jgi:hypothetical protein
MNSFNLFMQSLIVKQSRNYTSEYESAFILPASKGGKTFSFKNVKSKAARIAVQDTQLL